MNQFRKNYDGELGQPIANESNIQDNIPLNLQTAVPIVDANIVQKNRTLVLSQNVNNNQINPIKTFESWPRYGIMSTTFMITLVSFATYICIIFAIIHYNNKYQPGFIGCVIGTIILTIINNVSVQLSCYYAALNNACNTEQFLQCIKRFIETKHISLNITRIFKTTDDLLPQDQKDLNICYHNCSDVTVLPSSIHLPSIVFFNLTGCFQDEHEYANLMSIVYEGRNEINNFYGFVSDHIYDYYYLVYDEDTSFFIRNGAIIIRFLNLLSLSWIYLLIFENYYPQETITIQKILKMI